MTDIATFTNEQLIAVCRADVAEMSKLLKEGEFSNPSRAAMYLRITEIALAALMGEFSFARNQVRREHAEWSQATFGNVGPVGPLNHLSKEALEAAEQPGDLSEWADMQFLLWDAQRRAGVTDEQITQAMIDKLAVNKQREWPEPKDGEPRLHIKEQPAPVVSAELLHTAASAIEDLLTTKDRTGACVWFDLPFRLRSAANAQPAPVVPEEMTPEMMRSVQLNSELGAYAASNLSGAYDLFAKEACRAVMLAAAQQEVK